MRFRLLVLVAVLTGIVLAGSVQSQEPTGAILADESSLPLPLEYSAGWNVYLQASHIRERQSLPLELLKACHSPQDAMKQFWEKARLWVQSLPPRSRLVLSETLVDGVANSLWSVQDWKQLNLIWMLQSSMTTLFQLPCLAERLLDTKPVAATSGLEIAAGLGNLGHGRTFELCWRRFTTASHGGSREEVELTCVDSALITAVYQVAHIEGLCWSENRLRRRVLHCREVNLYEGLAIRLDIGLTSELGGDQTQAETLFYLIWYPANGTVLHICYDLFRRRLLHSGTMVW